jgi:hypothetical protein
LQEFIESGPGPHVVEGRPLNLGIGTALSNTPAQEDSRTSGSGLPDEVAMLRCQAGVWNLKRIEHSQRDEARQIGQ